MKVYLLFEKSALSTEKSTLWDVFEFNNSVWTDLNKLHAYIASLLDVEYPEIKKYASNCWIINNEYRIIETEVN